jgi:hypothetical protein
MQIGTVTYEEFVAWPERHRKLFNAVKRSRRGLWQASAPQWIDDQIIESCDAVADFIREDLG